MRWPVRSLAERFWSHVAKGDGCWEWQAARLPHGYGVFGMSVDGRWRMFRAHRVAYELAVGPVPAGLVVAHHCDNRACVRPGHLVAVSQRENLRDMYEKGRDGNRRRARNVCPSGHPYEGENIGRVLKRNGKTVRYCRECHRTRAREAYRRKRGIAA